MNTDTTIDLTKPLPDDFMVGTCYICRKKIPYNVDRDIGVEGHGDTAKLYHEDCMEHKRLLDRQLASTEGRATLARFLSYSGTFSAP